MAKKSSARGSRSRQSASRKAAGKKKKTLKKSAARAAKKKTGSKKKIGRKKAAPRARPRRVAAPEAPALEGVALTPEVTFRATAAGCLDQEVATALVFGCIPGAVPLGTPLGTLFPSDVVRRGFCGCVFNTARAAGSTLAPGAVPCSALTSVGDVIDAISC